MNILTLAIKYDIPTETISEEVGEIPVITNPRLRTRLGVAKWYRNGDRTIELNPKLGRDPEMLRNTIAHEIAHHVAGLRAGHNALWRAAALALGCDGNQCVTVEAAAAIGIERKRMTRKVVARCEKCDYAITRARALPRGKDYTHKRCGGKIIATR